MLHVLHFNVHVCGVPCVQVCGVCVGRCVVCRVCRCVVCYVCRCGVPVCGVLCAGVLCVQVCGVSSWSAAHLAFLTSSAARSSSFRDLSKRKGFVMRTKRFSRPRKRLWSHSGCSILIGTGTRSSRAPDSASLEVGVEGVWLVMPSKD